MKSPSTTPFQAPEPWVDTLTVAEHLGYGRNTVARMAEAGQIPSIERRSGKRTYRRFKLSAVDAALMIKIR